MLLVGGAALFLLVRAAGPHLPAFVGWVQGLGGWGTVAFVAGYALATVALLPGSILTLVGGAIFGVVWGTVYVLLAATIGASIAFLVARHLARPLVERWLRGDPRFERIDRAVGARGAGIVFLLRLSPVLPFNLLNYALGLTRVRFRDYLIASAGMVPGTVLYVYYGKVAGDAAAVLSGAGVTRGAGYYVVLGVGLAATVAVTALVTRIARRALAEATQDSQDV